jgi:hypothetical protein
MRGRWYRTNELENAVESLEQAARFHRSRLRHRWKWLMIALHGAMYGFSVCAVRGTDPDRVMNGENLISPREALIRCQSDAYMLQYVHSTRLQLSDEEKEAVAKLLNWIRDNLLHFRPHFWSIEIEWLAYILKHSTRVIRFLALESGNVRLDEVQRRRVARALNALSR